ncbi:MAG: ATP-binding protein [Acidobacteriota bacterium]|nr:ATP-binding protein [Acidobacteriota bacterium]
MIDTDVLPRAEILSMGLPVPEELAHTGVSASFLCDLALKHMALTPDPSTQSVADDLHLPWPLAEELLQQLYREKQIEVRLRSVTGMTRYGMLDRGWERVSRSQAQCGYTGPAPVSLADYSDMTRVQAVPENAVTAENIRAPFSDLVLPESLLQTLGCVINSRRSLFITGPPGTGKTAIAQRMNAGLAGNIWIPYAIEIDGQIIRVFDSHNHRPVLPEELPSEYDRRWVLVERPLVVVGGELTLENADLTWSATAKFYEAPFQMKSNGGTLVIDDFGRQRVAPVDLLNRWIVPLERRVDYLTLHTGKKIEVPFEQLVVFSTNLDEKDLVDEAFLRRMGYRVRVELPTQTAYAEIFKRVASAKDLRLERACLEHVLDKYVIENRPMKACEPRDLVERVTDICRFEGLPLELTPKVIDLAWRNYFGASHGFEQSDILQVPYANAASN